MSNTPTTKLSKHDSQKTPGGISKSLLTPCRRIGLSKKWRKSGVSPFISPLATDTSNKDVKPEEFQQKKTRTSDRVKEVNKVIPNVKETVDDDKIEDDVTVEKENSDTNSTPKSIQLPKRGKSKLFNKVAVNTGNTQPTITEPIKELIVKSHEEPHISEDELPKVSKPVNSRSMRKAPKSSPKVSKPIVIPCNELKPKEIAENKKETSPNNLTKECIVVIQKKINKNTLNSDTKTDQPECNPVSQALFDSDSDDTPLSKMNKTMNSKPEIKRKLPIDDDEDFCPTKATSKVKKLEDKKTSTGDLRKLQKKIINKSKPEPKLQLSQSSNSFDEDDEAFDTKKTILIKKTYDKPTKPLRAKSTGSITQKDIDELKAQIERKKNAILARAMTKDTEELRNLIKKWKKGCQDALMELMELLKSKFPDKQNMDYSEILQMLKIPSNLIGYDSDNDCFVSPDDRSIILTTLDV